MLILVENPAQLMWTWHDAECEFFLLEWSNDGELSVRFRCEINPEEDRQELIDMGITTLLVDVVFRTVRQLQTKVPEVTATQPVVIDWDVIDTFPIGSIDNNSNNPQLRRFQGLQRHRIGCSDGSEMELLFKELWIEEVLISTTGNA